MSAFFPDLCELKKGNESAWQQAFPLLWPIAFHAALHPHAALTPDEAEDVAIEALTKLVSKISLVETWDQLKALLTAIAYRGAISLARHKSATKRPQIAVHLDALPPTEGEKIIDCPGATGTLNETDLGELTHLLHQAMSGLDEITRRLLFNNVVDGLSFRELSEKYAMPSGTVSAKVARGLKRIQATVQKNAKLLQELKAFLR